MLWVEIHEKDTPAEFGERGAKIDRCCGLTDTTFLVHNRDDGGISMLDEGRRFCDAQCRSTQHCGRGGDIFIVECRFSAQSRYLSNNFR